VTGDGTQGNHQAGEVDLAEYTGIGSKDIAAGGEALLEVVPERDARHVEQWLGNAVGADARQTAEDKHINDSRKHRLDEVPEWTKDGLLVHGDDVPADVHPIEVTVTPQALDVYIEPGFLRGNFGDIGCHL